MPNNTAEHQKVINGCYNLYYPLTHTIEEGKWPVIKGFLEHCFGSRVLPSGHTNFDMIMDYLTILYRHPTQMLPIGVLYSKENNTGKSTMLWLMEAIFIANYTEINGDILEDTFNDDWVTRLVAGMDEGIIEKNKVYQKLKSLCVAHYANMRAMHVGRKRVPFFCKFWFTTNDITFIRLEKEDTRWWINEVPVLKTVDPDILAKMQAEVPYFLYDIANREIKHPRVSRHWFAPHLLQTDIGQKMKDRSKGWFEKEITTILTDEFFEYRWHSLYFTHKEVLEMLNGRNSATRFRSDDIRQQMKDIFGLEADLQRWHQPNKPDDTNAYSVRTSEKHQRCYEFRIEQFVPVDLVKAQLGDYFDIDKVLAGRDDKLVPVEEKMPF